MKHSKKIIAGAALLLTGICAQAQFTPGDLVVLQDGTGSSALTSASTAIFLDEFGTSPSGFVTSFAIPTTGAGELVNSGSATSEGQISLSADGQSVVVSGYNTGTGVASIASTSSSTVPRGVATVNYNGVYTLQGTTTSFSGNNIRSGTTDGNGNFWAVGANSGVVYLNSSGSSPVSTNSTNNRLIQDIGGNLFFSTGSGSTRGIYEVIGTPNTAPVTATSFINTSVLGSVSPYGFAFNSSMTVAYIADSDAYTTSSGFGGIEKWEFNGTSWAFQYSLPTDGVGADGLAVNFSGADPVIYATSGDGTSLFAITDTGSSATDTLLDTAGTDEAFRGLTFAPQAVPEPAALALLAVGFPGAYWFLRRNRKA